MKKILLTGLLALGILLASETMAGAQIVVEYKKQTSNSTLVVRYSSGGYYGWGTYWGAPPYYTVPYTYAPYSYGTPYGYGGWWVPRPIVTYSDPYCETRPIRYSTPTVTTPPRRKKQESLDQGISRFRSADYRGAVESFREAFLADTESGMAQLCLGLALSASGDRRNADKALRGAFASLKPDEALSMDFAGWFRDVQERQRLESALEKASDGRLAAGVVAFLLGRKDIAKSELSKVKDDPAARKLLDHLGP